MIRRNVCFVICAALALGVCLRAQEKQEKQEGAPATSTSVATAIPADPSRLTFDVASIKPTKFDPQAGGGIKALPNAREYVAQQAPVKLMIALMYKIPMRQITGGPDWINTDVWDIDAKCDQPHTLDELHTMYKNMLADEFKLKFHIETKEGNMFGLSVDKSGLKMKPNDSPETWEIPITGAGFATFNGKRVNMEYLTWFLGQVLQNDERPVVDLTGLKGYYDFKLSFMPELPPNVNRENLPPDAQDRPSIFDALKQQLGLKLESQKGPVPYMVVDRLEKPAGN